MKKGAILILIIGLFTACQQAGMASKENQKNKLTLSSISIIPEPVSVKPQQGKFRITPATVIQFPAQSKKSRWAAKYLKEQITASTGYANMVMTTSSAAVDTNRIILTLASDTSGFGNSKGYKLLVTSKNVHITAPTGQGLFYGVQSLLQLFPPQVLYHDYAMVPLNIQWTAPAVKIRDYPRFSYRGMHLDVARHFMPVEFVKQYIDIMAMYKLNRLHWHLTDDQGWRIQIKQYPKLTKIGAWRDSTIIGRTGRYNHHRTGGFYTQEEIREVIEYAKKRFVTIIPEIEMPGHSSAALAAYPKLGCNKNENYHVKSRWGIFNDIYCPSDYTFNFLKNVLTEVMKLFPSQYIHLGGDEVPYKAWKNSKLAQRVMEREGLETYGELHSYFIDRIENFLNDHGHRVMGWEEIFEADLSPKAIIQSWHGYKDAIRAAEQGHYVVMSANDYLYFNFPKANPETEPIAQPSGTLVPLEKVYSFDPVPDKLTKEQAQYILGIESALWSEYIASPRKAEYAAYPRALALAEIAWSPKIKHDWGDFWQRLQTHFKRFDVMDVDYSTLYKGQKPHVDYEIPPGHTVNKYN